MKTTRPINLDLKTLKLPVTAISSILHRVAGVVLFLAIPLLLWLLSNILSKEANYSELLLLTDSLLMKFILWAILTALSYHILAGVRHLIMDMGFGETLEVARLTSTLTIVLGLIAAATWGVWIW